MSKNQNIENKKSSQKRPTVAGYLTAQIALCGKSQIEIARECGFDKPNIITMLKNGQTKLPVARVGQIARALGVDPLYLFSLVMTEYEPETWKIIQESILKQPYVSANEIEIIEVVRSANVANPKVRTDKERERLLAVIDALQPDNSSARD